MSLIDELRATYAGFTAWDHNPFTYNAMKICEHWDDVQLLKKIYEHSADEYKSLLKQDISPDTLSKALKDYLEVKADYKTNKRSVDKHLKWAAKDLAIYKQFGQVYIDFLTTREAYMTLYRHVIVNKHYEREAAFNESKYDFIRAHRAYKEAKKKLKEFKK